MENLPCSSRSAKAESRFCSKGTTQPYLGCVACLSCKSRGHALGVEARGTSCSCSVNHFACTTPQYGNCTCIPVRWRCDSDDDCGDGSDEIDCDAAACSRDMFMCNSGKCIITSWWCDGENDCGDYSDETDCSARNCSKKEFPCANGRCIPSDWRCDGTNQCGDNSDEDCSAQSCAPNEFRCNDGGCIIVEWTCDRSVDCQDGSDEEGCHEENYQTCPPNEFRCVNSRCISESYVCDGDNDCGDWSDESKCQTCYVNVYCDDSRCTVKIMECIKHIIIIPRQQDVKVEHVKRYAYDKHSHDST
ncbi:Low-density lipoprotein receptor-related protein like [Argiope bruennichi]|uniref:Low-density lipoprotein receptor-related protein like n=1 Tax=Argiope bruennichi TaxID=94029 RepID=A0A8T0FZ03_ARGBR|nr:Low-density lipoprotein receptor-related protein like [Argiope bruennichi]